MEEALLIEFKQNAIFRLEEGQRMLHLAFAKVGEDSLWKLPVKNGMALGNQLLHVCGNMTQYVLASLGQEADQRQRDSEFSTTEGCSKAELLQQLDVTVSRAIKTIQTTSPSEYLRVRKVQGFEFSGVGVVLHAVEHFSYHVGQVAFWVKQLTEVDLGFYDHHDLTQIND